MISEEPTLTCGHCGHTTPVTHPSGWVEPGRVIVDRLIAGERSKAAGWKKLMHGAADG